MSPSEQTAPSKVGLETFPINDDAQHVAEMAEECMIMMQDLVMEKQLTLQSTQKWLRCPR